MYKKKRHVWKEQEGFRRDKCQDCGALRYWDQGFQRIVYMAGNGTGPFFWAPTCISNVTTKIEPK
jgi:hypothetical protein